MVSQANLLFVLYGPLMPEGNRGARLFGFTVTLKTGSDRNPGLLPVFSSRTYVV